MTPRQCKAIFLRKVDPIGFLLNSRQNIGTGNLCVQKRYLRHWSLALSLVLLLLADSSLAIISSLFPKTQQPTVGSSLKLIGLRYPGLEMLHVSCSMETLSCSLFFLKFSYKVTNRLFAIFFLRWEVTHLHFARDGHTRKSKKPKSVVLKRSCQFQGFGPS